MAAPAFMTERVFFDYDKSALKMEAQALLKKKAEWLKSTANAKLTIEGNCDERGTAEYNLALGERRAQAAKKFLVDLGIDAKRITTISYGKERPIDPAHNEAAWSKNRNDGFVVSF
jgi:peptidoglycan-associated lipoprotein